MNAKLETLIEAVRELTLLEQLQLVSVVSQSLYQNYQQTTQPVIDFWTPRSLEQHILAQGTQPVVNIADLVADFWPEEESADDFITYIYEQRREDRLKA